MLRLCCEQHLYFKTIKLNKTLKLLSKIIFKDLFKQKCMHSTHHFNWQLLAVFGIYKKKEKILDNHKMKESKITQRWISKMCVGDGMCTFLMEYIKMNTNLMENIFTSNFPPIGLKKIKRQSTTYIIFPFHNIRTKISGRFLLFW